MPARCADQMIFKIKESIRLPMTLDLYKKSPSTFLYLFSRNDTRVITTKSATDQVLIFLLISSLLLSRVAKAMLLRRALI
jgi:hypothetical protein